MTRLALAVRRTLLAAALLGAGAAPWRAAAQSVPARLADTTFWRLMREYSEPGGTFRSENFVSNETSLQWVIPELTRRIAPGGVYLGVAPDQNFTYIAAVRPSIAFIVDIRHQNAMQHLMYKALIETSATRAEFLAKLFARAPLVGVDSTASATQLFEALARQPADSGRYRDNLQALTDRLVRLHRFALSDSERVALGCVYGAFFTQGPELTYNYSSECRNPGPYGSGMATPGPPSGAGMRMGFRMPTYQAMMTETDSAGVNWSYLGSERRYRALREMQERNLIVPITGNFAGARALRAVGAWAAARNARVTTFYVSNVEQYLFQQGDEARRFYENVATLPIDSTSTFVRSFSGGRFAVDAVLTLRPQSPAGRSLQMTSPIGETLRAFGEDRLTSWLDVIRMSRQ